MAIKNINALFANINLLRILLKRIILTNILLALFVASLHFSITTTMIIHDKKCNHSFFQAKSTVKLPPSMSNIIGKENFKRMRHSIHLVITALTMFYIGGTSFRKIALILKILYNIKVSYVTISDWCKKFAPIFHSKMLTLMPAMNFNFTLPIKFYFR